MGKYILIFFIFPLVTLIAAILLTLLNIKTPTFHQKNLNVKNIETVLLEKTNVLNPDGTLNVRGWSRSPLLYHFNRENIRASTSLVPFLDKLRYKKWEFYFLIHKDFILGFGVFDLSYLGGHLIHYYDLTKSNTEVFTDESLNLINKPYINDNCWNDCQSTKYLDKNHFAIDVNKEFNKNSQKINFNFNSKKLNITLSSKVGCPECDSIVTTTPISQDTSLFYHNTKTYGLHQSGRIDINGKKYNLDDIQIIYDSGRGVWPLYSGWLWSTSNGKTEEGNVISINIGHGFSHPESSVHTEDAFFINGKIFKLPAVNTKEVKHDYPRETTYWSFESVEHPVIKNRCDFKMEILKKHSIIQDLIIAKSIFNLNYGTVSGKCIDDTGKVHKFSNLLGFLENKLSNW